MLILDAHLCQLELLLLVNLDELDFGFLQEVEHPLVGPTEANSMAGATDFQCLSTVPSYGFGYICARQQDSTTSLDDNTGKSVKHKSDLLIIKPPNTQSNKELQTEPITSIKSSHSCASSIMTNKLQLHYKR